MFLREPSHVLILVIVLVLLFGAKRLPDSARALGKSMKIFKSEVKELNSDKPTDEDKGKERDGEEGKKGSEA